MPIDDTSDDESYDNMIEENDEDVPDDFEPTTFFNSQKQLCYYKMIDKYFKKCSLDLREKMVKIINSESSITTKCDTETSSVNDWNTDNLSIFKLLKLLLFNG